MAEYIGNAMYVGWIYAGGTATLSANFQKVTETPSIDLVDVTAGADTTKVYLASFKDYKVNVSGLEDTGGTIGALAGTALGPGASGTLVVGPEGTATGKPKRSYPVMSQGVVRNYAYAGASEFSIDFQGWGAMVEATF